MDAFLEFGCREWDSLDGEAYGLRRVLGVGLLERRSAARPTAASPCCTEGVFGARVARAAQRGRRVPPSAAVACAREELLDVD